jgi:hypothetical protein
MKMLTEPFILILELPAWASAAYLTRSCELEACRAAPVA